MYTIRHYKKDFSNLTVAIVGDVLHSRVARSDIHALTTLGCPEVRVVVPKTLVPADMAQMGVRVCHTLEEGIRGADVIIMLRLQNERMRGALLPSAQEYFKHYGLTEDKLALAAPDADTVSRLIGMGETVRLRLSSTAHTYETVSQNVIGDIPGRTRPDEIIVLGSHMDSWDLGTGAIDDGAGGAITLAAAKAIAESGRRPARTVRVVPYGAEEVDQPTDTGNGGGAYLRGIGAAVEQHIIAGESDFGADRVYALQLPPGAQGSDFARAAAQVLYPIGVLSSSVPELSGGADIAPLAGAGVPVFGLSQDGTRYFDLHHTADDTLDKIDPAQLSQNVAAWAGLVWLIADSEVDFRALRAAAAR
jgi:hypothetical protein